MICDFCRIAGNAITEHKRKALVIAWGGVDAVHAQCAYPESCPCQHRVTLDAIRPEV